MNFRSIGPAIGMAAAIMLQCLISPACVAADDRAESNSDLNAVCSRQIRGAEAYKSLQQLEKIAARPGNPNSSIGQAAANIDFAPSGASIELGIRRPFEDFTKLGTVHAIFQSRLEPSPMTDPDAVRPLSTFNIHPRKVIESDSLRKSGIVELEDTIISLDLPPDDQAFWQWGRITIFVCSRQKDEGQISEVTFISQTDLRVSGWRICQEFALAATLIAYFCIAALVAGYENSFRKKFGIPSVDWIYYLSPIRLASGADGRGSPSRIQALGFSILVGFLSFYTTLRQGVLSDLSPSVATLLGISAAGAVLGKATDVARNSLSANNMAWLISYRWLQDGGTAWRQTPQWRHLITSDDGFDLQRAQMLGFSFVVALALIERGASGLSTFAIPDTVNQILGISQLVYIGGKAVGPATIKDLDSAIDKLRELENTLAGKVSLTDGQTLTKEIAAAAGASPEYGAYLEQAIVIRKLVSSIFETGLVSNVQTARFGQFNFNT